MANTISFNTPLSINDLTRAVEVERGAVTFVINGEPGIGKSTIHQELKRILGDGYDHIYVDCPVKDFSDIGMYIPNHESRSLSFYPSDLFKLSSPKPKVIMLDEFAKSPKLLQTMWTRLMLEHSIGDVQLPAGSIVFATSNNSSDGVGDTMLAHAGNRVCIVQMRKPSAMEWLSWASENGISATTRAWVAMESRCLASYLDGGQEDNPYIFRPGKSGLSFVTPRSLVKNDIHVRNRSRLGETVTKALIAGTVGVSAGESMAAYLSLDKELRTTKEVLADPANIPLPEKPAAAFMMMFNAIDDMVTQDDLSNFMIFINRLKSSEIQEMFFSMLWQNKRTTRIARNNKDVLAWSQDNLELLMP